MDPCRGHSLPEVSPGPPAVAAAAVFSPCGRYRWWLQRTWQPQRPTLVFVGLNPSRADDQRDDPTLRRLQAFGRRWGFGRLEVVNLFGAVATSPAALKRWSDPVGSGNDGWIRRCLGRPGPWCAPLLPACEPGAGPGSPPGREADGWERQHLAGRLLWLGWGNGGTWRGRDRALFALLAEFAIRPFALRCTASGQPGHPLYCAASMKLVPFAPSWGDDPE